MASNFFWLKIKGMKIDSKKRQQKRGPIFFRTVLKYLAHVTLVFSTYTDFFTDQVTQFRVLIQDSITLRRVLSIAKVLAFKFNF